MKFNMTEEEYCMLIGAKEVELYLLTKQLGAFQDELNLRRSQQQSNIRAVGGRIRDSPVAQSEQEVGAFQRAITEVYSSEEETEKIRRSSGHDE